MNIRICASIVLVLAVIVFGGHKAFADAPPGFYRIPQNLAADGTSNWVGPGKSNPNYINLSATANAENGSGGFVRSFKVKIYTLDNGRTNTDRTISLKLIDRDSCKYKIQASVRDKDTGLYVPIGSSEKGVNWSEAKCYDSISWTISDNDKHWESGSSAEGMGGIKYATVDFYLETPDSPYTSTTAPIDYVRSYDDSRLGFAQYSSVPIRSTRKSDSPNGGVNKEKYKIVFGVPCNQVKTTKSFSWKDDDYFDGSTTEVSGISTKLTRKADTSKDPDEPGARDRVLKNEDISRISKSDYDEAVQSRGFDSDTRGGYGYSWDFLNVDSGNTIYIKYPYDSANFYIDCTPKASCSLNITGGLGVPNRGYPAVRVGQSYTVTATITNTGSIEIPDTWDGYPLSLTGPGQNNISFGGIPPGQSRTTSFTYTAPSNVRQDTITKYVDYYGDGGISEDCSMTTSSYKEFDIKASATVDDASGRTDVENPDNIFWYTGGAEQAGFIPPYPISSTVVSRLVKTDGTGADNVLGGGQRQLQSFSDSGSFGTRTFPASPPDADGRYEYNDSLQGSRALGAGGAWVAGDKICAEVTIDVGHGWAGPGGDVAKTASAYDSDCPKVTNKPYVSVYGADVAAGGGWCGKSGGVDSSISAYAKQGGSGTQLAAFATGSIGGFKSLFLKGAGDPASSNKLTFGNSPPNNGGYGLVDCNADFYTNDQYPSTLTSYDATKTGKVEKTYKGNIDDTQPDAVKVNATAFPDNNQTVVKPTGGTLTLSGGNFNGQHSIFVDGDVYIKDSIAYSTTDWANIAEIPFFNLVVKGNIYIDPSVTQLDGRYIAQPKDDGSGGGGEIYTCAPGGSAPAIPGGALWSSCQTKLTINGQFLAKTIRFLRTANTISDGTFKETAGNAKAGEVFNFSPEMYLARPAVQPKSGPGTGTYQSILTMPPIL